MMSKRKRKYNFFIAVHHFLAQKSFFYKNDS